MRILVVGAGAVGGYFGGRLLQAGRDVTFLVRPRRGAELAKHGLTIRSRLGDFHRSSPPIVLEDGLEGPFDLVLLSCKAYDLDGAMASFAKAVGPATAVLPLLNGMRHIDRLAERFGTERVLGGQCAISATLGADGAVVHLNDWHALSFGELDGSRSPRIETIAQALLNAGFDARLSDEIRQEMWEKWIFIASAAGITCLMRAAVGDYIAAGAVDLATGLLSECASIAAAQGFPPRAPALERARAGDDRRGLASEGLDAARYRRRQAGRGGSDPRRSAAPRGKVGLSAAAHRRAQREGLRDRPGRAERAPPSRDHACAAGRLGISACASRAFEGEKALAEAAPINWTNAMTLLSVAILVGTELVGAGAAAGWAIGGLFQLGATITRMLEGVLILTALTGLFYFLRAAVAHEPIRG